ncbi:Response regulator receiver domain-containing protein [Enhydrobacter aerosaccus]|uniref:Response regulator receiver domain-containing protein n=1 Tax=Enhydrobacter aerosaccus TaxID=225324 RepID=A0A1T4SPY4_9HYPH|nr:response regulator [Enhydrobacter aerosaccus]SKA30216.1 Response regulator receiver domain-containing protein [Enhydrobacter aerosaccus]
MIFIVDDDSAIRESLRFLLSCEGLEAQSFASANALLDTGTIGAGDCVITDIHLPGMDGLALLRTIRARGLKIPVIVMTGWPNSLVRQRAHEMGATLFLEKPLKDAEILAAVKNCLSAD